MFLLLLLSSLHVMMCHCVVYLKIENWEKNICTIVLIIYNKTSRLAEAYQNPEGRWMANIFWGEAQYLWWQASFRQCKCGIITDYCQVWYSYQCTAWRSWNPFTSEEEDTTCHEEYMRHKTSALHCGIKRTFNTYNTYTAQRASIHNALWSSLHALCEATFSPLIL